MISPPCTPCTVDPGTEGADPFACRPNTQYAYSGLVDSDNPHQITVAGVDSFGNASMITREFDTDTTAPAITNVSCPLSLTADETCTFSVTDASAIDCECQFDSATPVECDGSGFTATAGFGLHLFTVVCSDPFGNISSSETGFQDGLCEGIVPVVCTALDQCHEVGTCDETTGDCSNPFSLSTKACDDSDACTQSDFCDGNGNCVGGDPVICESQGQCYDVGTCDSSSGLCSNPPSSSTTTCDDGIVCTTNDLCDGAGGCFGDYPQVCAPPAFQLYAYEGNGGPFEVYSITGPSGETTDVAGDPAYDAFNQAVVAPDGETMWIAGTRVADSTQGLIVIDLTANPATYTFDPTFPAALCGTDLRGRLIGLRNNSVVRFDPTASQGYVILGDSVPGADICEVVHASDSVAIINVTDNPQLSFFDLSTSTLGDPITVDTGGRYPSLAGATLSGDLVMFVPGTDSGSDVLLVDSSGNVSTVGNVAGTMAPSLGLSTFDAVGDNAYLMFFGPVYQVSIDNGATSTYTASDTFGATAPFLATY